MSQRNRNAETKKYGIDVILIDPHGDIGKAIEDKDWVSGFSYAIKYIEHFGTIKIKNFVDSRIINGMEDQNQKREARNRYLWDLKRSSVASITFNLFVLGLIDSITYLDLRKIIVERNRLVHPQKKGAGFQHSKEEEQKRRTMLQKAQELIERIQQIKI